MRTGIRIVVCTALIAVAVTMVMFTIAGFTGRESEQSGMYVLRAADGNVAVFDTDDPDRPVTVTEIELASLREADRAMIADGLPVESPEELARLLEDLGS